MPDPTPDPTPTGPYLVTVAPYLTATGGGRANVVELFATEASAYSAARSVGGVVYRRDDKYTMLAALRAIRDAWDGDDSQAVIQNIEAACWLLKQSGEAA